MPLPCAFFRQSHPNLCAYYAAKHFLCGKLDQNAFENTATNYYMRVLSMTRSDAQQLVQQGNDPAILADVLQGQGTSTTQLGPSPGTTYSRILLALKNRPHFITVLKDSDGKWWNYDSLLSAPQEISSIATFLSANPVHEYYVA
jgi:hypothetical protein